MTVAPSEAVERLSEPWAQVLEDFDSDLRVRSAAEKTRRAYRSDVARFARWCMRNDLEPAQPDVRTLRRYAASLSQGGLRPTSLARNVASLRSFYRMLREHGGQPGVAADAPQASALAAARAASRRARDSSRSDRRHDAA